MNIKTGLTVACAVLMLAAVRGAAQENVDIAEQGYRVLKKYCYSCHGLNMEVADLKVLERETMVAERGGDPPFVIPGNLEDSYLWLRVGIDQDMPPDDSPQPSDEEREVIQRWIEAGAPFPDASERPLKSERDILNAIRDHLNQSDPADRPFLKYFTMAQFHNDANLSGGDLRNGPAALSKLVNSMSWKRRIVVPEAADEEGLVYGVDVRRLGWVDRDVWSEVLKAYPYGVNYSDSVEESVRDLAQEVVQLTGDPMPFVRADWFIATASRPPLYHFILDLPEDVKPLRRLLNVDVEAGIRDNLVRRAGFATSGVSEQNRIVDRHTSIYGAYWESYDFKPKGDKSDIFQFPLGPKFEGNVFQDQAFEHDGGEVIFNLPNGLQGYFLTDEKGVRINVGPTDVVHDSLRTSGSVAIVNGLSCMACHQRGIRPFKDSIRDGRALFEKALFKVQAIVPKQEEMDRLIKRDQDRFLKALDVAMGPFLRQGVNAEKPIGEFSEPVGEIARRYAKDLGPKEIALELGLTESDEVRYVVRGNRSLRRLGLGPLAAGQTIKRDKWSQLSSDNVSLFQLVAEEFEQGTPFVPTAGD